MRSGAASVDRWMHAVIVAFDAHAADHNIASATAILRSVWREMSVARMSIAVILMGGVLLLVSAGRWPRR